MYTSLEVAQNLEYMRSVFCTRSVQNKYLHAVLCGILYFFTADNLLRLEFPGNVLDAYVCLLLKCVQCLHDLYLMQ